MGPVRHRRPPSQAWRTFLSSHVKESMRCSPHSRTHLSLEKDPPIPRAVEPPEFGKVVELREVAGLHHRERPRSVIALSTATQVSGVKVSSTASPRVYSAEMPEFVPSPLRKFRALRHRDADCRSGWGRSRDHARQLGKRLRSHQIKQVLRDQHRHVACFSQSAREESGRGSSTLECYNATTKCDFNSIPNMRRAFSPPLPTRRCNAFSGRQGYMTRLTGPMPS